MTASVPTTQRLWDGPTRFVHWAIAILFGISWWSAEQHAMNYHYYSGYALLGLVVFRVYWGFAGGSTARFANFVRGPATTWRYAKTLPRRMPSHTPGHNPMGAWSVLALLALLALQIGLGLFSVDVDGFESGPFSHYVSFDTSRACAEWHETVFNVLLALVVLHLVAVLFYWLWKRDNLIRPMLTGTAAIPGNDGLRRAGFVALAAGIGLAAGAVWLVAF